MKQTRRVRVTITQRRTRRFQTAIIRAWCPACGREVETLTTALAAEVLETGIEELARLKAAGLLHELPTISGGSRICRDSLFVPGR